MRGRKFDVNLSRPIIGMIGSSGNNKINIWFLRCLDKVYRSWFSGFSRWVFARGFE